MKVMCMCGNPLETRYEPPLRRFPRPARCLLCVVQESQGNYFSSKNPQNDLLSMFPDSPVAPRAIGMLGH